MRRELGIARCGLACCLCSENVTCKGCSRDGFLELSWCKDAEWCENRKCVIEKSIAGCYECSPAVCRKGLYAENVTATYFTIPYIIMYIEYTLTTFRSVNIVSKRTST